jgi:hypothetical protein
MLRSCMAITVSSSGNVVIVVVWFVIRGFICDDMTLLVIYLMKIKFTQGKSILR